MKRISTRILAMVLACALICALAGCTTSPLSSDTSKPFSRGTVSGSDFTSDFLGLTFHAPSGWSFYSDQEINATLNTASSYTSDPAAFEAALTGALTDFLAVAPGETSNVSLTYSKEAYISAADAAKSSSAYAKMQYEQMGLSCSVTEPVSRTLCGREYQMTVLNAGGVLTQYVYITIVGNYVASIAGSFTDGTTMEEFEAMFR